MDFQAYYLYDSDAEYINYLKTPLPSLQYNTSKRESHECEINVQATTDQTKVPVFKVPQDANYVALSKTFVHILQPLR